LKRTPWSRNAVARGVELVVGANVVSAWIRDVYGNSRKMSGCGNCLRQSRDQVL
jgi:hypothetical protein